MRRLSISLCFAFVFLLDACGSSSKGIVVTDARSLSTAPGISTAVVYLDIKSSGGSDALTAAAVDPSIAAGVSLHQTTNQTMDMNGMNMDEMGMDVVTSIPLPSGKTVALAPAGYHLMLEGLKKTLFVGETYKAHLQFRSGSSKDIQVLVRNSA